MLPHVRCGRLFGIAADLADHDDRFRFRIFIKELERIDECCPNDRIATDANGCRLPYAALRELINSFVSQSPGTGNDSDVPLLVNASGHDADFALAWRYDPWAIRSDQPRTLSLQIFPRANHVHCGNAFSDTDNQWHAGIGSFHDRICRKWRGHEYDGHVGPGFAHGLFNSVKDVPTFMRCATFARRHATDNLGSVFGTAFSVKRALTSGNALDNETCLLVNKY